MLVATETLNNLSELSEDSFPLTYKLIAQEQQKDKSLLKLLKEDSQYDVTQFHGGGKAYSLIIFKNKIVLPSSLQQKAVDWYHTVLCHPGETRTEATIQQHSFKGLKAMVYHMC